MRYIKYNDFEPIKVLQALKKMSCLGGKIIGNFNILYESVLKTF